MSLKNGYFIDFFVIIQLIVVKNKIAYIVLIVINYLLLGYESQALLNLIITKGNMNKIKTMMIAAIAIASFSSSLFAGSLGVGISMGIADVATSGKEVTTAGTVAGGAANTNNATAANDAVIGSAYVEYAFNDVSWGKEGNGITIGFNMTPGTAKLSRDVQERREVSAKDAATQGAQNEVYKAQAEINNLTQTYIELPIFSYVYAKFGVSSVDVNTLEQSTEDNGDTKAHGVYGGASLDGDVFGVGLKGMSGNLLWKVSYEETDFDTLSITSTTSNKITADIDTEVYGVSLGYRF